MAECVTVATGAVVATGEDTTECSGYVLLTKDDYQNLQHSGVLPPLSIADGTEIAMAMVLCMSAGWIWGQIAKALNV